MPVRLVVPRAIFDSLLSQAQTEQPLECCGLLAGNVREGFGRVSERYPLPNAAASPILYEADPRALFAAHKNMRTRALDLLAVYHSHPTSQPIPSATDHRTWFHGEEVVCIIISLLTAPPTVRGWWLREDGTHQETEIEVEEANVARDSARGS